MRKYLGMALAVLVVTIGATTARADSTSTIDFDTTFGQAPTSGSIDCDSVGCPNSITATVVWEGLTFNFSDAALTGGLQPNIGAAYPACSAADGSPALAYQTLDNCSGVDGWDTVNVGGNWILSLDSGTPGNFVEAVGVGTANEDATASGGSFTDPPAATPEPGSGALMLTGLALMGFMLARKRIAQAGEQAA
jgi:PEP-CTERM motif-containing protein